jgi:hypothetical protein
MDDEEVAEMAEHYGMTVAEYEAWMERMSRIQSRNYEAATLRRAKQIP